MSNQIPLVVITDKSSVDADDLKIISNHIKLPNGDFKIVSATLEGIEQVLPENNGGKYHEFVEDNCYELIKKNLNDEKVKKSKIKIQHCKAENDYTYILAYSK